MTDRFYFRHGGRNVNGIRAGKSEHPPQSQDIAKHAQAVTNGVYRRFSEFSRPQSRIPAVLFALSMPNAKAKPSVADCRTPPGRGAAEGFTTLGIRSARKTERIRR